ncbi:MAG: 2-dehydro-3-deoxyphosphooctonate aldolase (KDO 8-P synthase) [Chlamydiales bacterium]|jgi:2-dehydro-3-deoxyphosphooctonate aldolase (KDO 8-P synthase)
MQSVEVKEFVIGRGQPLAVICGPCVIEGEDHCLSAAETLKEIFSKFDINFIFKASYDKANRSSISSYRGPGLDEGLRILERVKKELEVPVLTDVHSPAEAAAAGEVVDVLQIPAFLCRQTDLLVAAGNTGKPVNIKKGQFMAPWDMQNVIEKVLSTDNNKIILTDRGTSFGYNNLVSDMRSIAIMQGMGYPVCFDATHSVQLPGGHGTTSGGQREYVALLARSAVAAGCLSLFMEAHPDPSQAKSDKDSMLPFEELPSLLRQLEGIYKLVQEQRVLQE